MENKDMLEKGMVEFIGREEVEKKIASGEKLKIKWGADPTAPDLHLGHAVILNKLKQFQDGGHEVILIIGDYTSQVGDPSGKNKTRPMLTSEQIEEGAKTYLEQVGKILDVDKITIKKNSEWFADLKFDELIKLLSKLTVASILERDDFSKRFKEGSDIGLHELLYPFMQAYDSVMVKPDIEIGGTDQKFNMLAGRTLMKKMDIKPQAVITMPLLLGTDGVKKMSKSLGNYIGINEAPAEIFGKTMSIPDELIVPYYELCTNVTPDALEIIEDELKSGENPRDIKARLAKMIVETYHNAALAEEAENEFDKVFKDKQQPTEIPELNMKKTVYALADIVSRAGISSLSEAKRLISQGGVRINDEVITDPSVRIETEDGMVLQIGKRRFFKIKLT